MAKSTVATTVVSFVQVQTLRGNQGTPAAFAEVEKVVAGYNAANKAKHVARLVTQMPNNTKGMAFQLALLATVARSNGVSMVRLGVHNGHVALCGPLAGIEATRLEMQKSVEQYGTMVANAIQAHTPKSRVGFQNGYLCGCPAGLQSALGIQATLAYGLGFLYTFPAPGDGTAYAIGHAAALAAGKPTAERKTRKPTAERTTTNLHGVNADNDGNDLDAPASDAPASDAPASEAVAA